MISTIIKRDGRETAFNEEKIANAIFKAAEAIGGHDYQSSLELARMVSGCIEAEGLSTPPTVSTCRTWWKRCSLKTATPAPPKNTFFTAPSATRVREMNTRLMKIYEDLTFKPAKDNDVKRENANIDGDTAMGTMLKYGSEGAKQFL